MTPLGIDPGTVRLVAQHLSHYTTPGPTGWKLRGSNLGGEAIFSEPLQIGHVAHPASLYNGYQVFPGVKRPARDVNHSTLSSDEVKERVEL